MPTALKISFTALRQEILQDRDFRILCGAGISMVAPTMLPSGNDLRDDCVRHILEDRISKKVLRKVMRSAAYQRLLPERVLQDVGSFASKNVDRVIASRLANATPNPLHWQLTHRYPHIFTTNFDLCLEACGTKSVWHLHGTISSPHSLQNRLYRLGQTSRLERARFRAVVHGKPLLVLGYSMRDQDIIESIQAAQPSEILYLSYDGTLPAFLQNTDLPVRYCQGDAINLFGVARPSVPLRYPKVVHTCARPSVERRASAFLQLLYASGFYEEVDGVLKAYLPSLRGRGKYKAINSAVDALRLSGQYHEAVFWCDYIMNSEFANRPENAEILSTAYIVRGLIDLDSGSGHYAMIERSFRKGLALAITFESLQETDEQKGAIDVWKARIYNNLGLVLAAQRRYAAAKSYFRKSILIKKKRHEETGIAQTQSNLAKLFLETQQHAQAVDCLREVVRLMEKSPSRYVCSDAIREALCTIGRQMGLTVKLREPLIPIAPESLLWTRMFRHVRQKEPALLPVVDELKKINAILLAISTT